MHIHNVIITRSYVMVIVNLVGPVVAYLTADREVRGSNPILA